jgi:hypothetical protein
MALSEFHLFTRLPTELRHEIWRIALSNWAVVMAGDCPRGSRYLTWDPSTVGAACYEARSIMRASFQRIDLSHKQTIPRWLHFRTNIVWLGPAAEVRLKNDLLSAELWSNCVHIAIAWTTWFDVMKSIIRLGAKCRSLQTIVVFDSGSPLSPDPRHLEDGDIAALILSCKSDVTNFTSSWLEEQRTGQELAAAFQLTLKPPNVMFLPLYEAADPAT